jgi:hypothetical protein
MNAANHFYLDSNSRNISASSVNLTSIGAFYMFKWSIALLGSALLLGGCAPGHLFIEEGVVESIDQRLEAQDDQFNRLTGNQMLVLEQLASTQETVISQLQATIAEQVKPPKCEPIPRLVCPQPDSSGNLMLGGLEK